MSCKYEFIEFSEKGEITRSGTGFMPEFLDWMPIKAKIFWFRFMGQGDPDTKYVLLKSQGEQVLLIGVSLAKLDMNQYKEKERGASEAVNNYIEREGICRTPRNQ